MKNHQQIAAKLQLVLKSCKICSTLDHGRSAPRLSSPVHPLEVQEQSAQSLLLLRTVHAEHPQGSSVSVTLLMLVGFLPV